MKTEDAHLLSYHKYPLSRILSISEIVTADYIDSLVTSVIFDSPHVHENAVELIYCISGAFPVTRGDTCYTLGANDVLLIMPGERHFISSRLTDTTFFAISFTCTTDYLGLFRTEPFQVSGFQESLIRNIVLELHNAFRLNGGELRLFAFRPNARSPIGAEQMVLCSLEQLMIGFLRDVTQEKQSQSRYFNRVVRKQMIERVAYFVQSHLTEKITATEVAEAFGYSRARFSTIYKQATGLGLNEYITKEKISLAKRLLENGSMTVTQISDQLGFSSPEYFSRRFTQCVGYPPSKYMLGMQLYLQQDAAVPEGDT